MPAVVTQDSLVDDDVVDIEVEFSLSAAVLIVEVGPLQHNSGLDHIILFVFLVLPSSCYEFSYVIQPNRTSIVSTG